MSVSKFENGIDSRTRQITSWFKKKSENLSNFYF